MGRSDLVGWPLAQLMLQRDATVTSAHKGTRDLVAECRQADILVVAAGVPGLIGAAHVQPGATVIDVGIHRTADGLTGDVDVAAVADIAAYLTPVPGGVGPMTIAMLLRNTVEAWRLQAASAADPARRVGLTHEIVYGAVDRSGRVPSRRPPAQRGESMSAESLEDAIQRIGDPITLLRDAPARPHTFPVAAEFSNWRSEQHSWRESCALLDQSHHMTDLFVRGPDAVRLLSEHAVNSFAAFSPGRAKQYIATAPDGHLIGDGILLYLEPDSLDLVGHPMVVDWIEYAAHSGDYDVELERDDNSIVRRAGPPKFYRYELQGPTALAIVERLLGGPVPEIRFFSLAKFRIADVEVRALRHGMAGQPGFELFGPWPDGERIRDAILTAGADHGLVPVGAKGYSSANLESGWVPAPLPAIFTGEATKGYRRWLPAAKAGSLGGSFVPADISGYYLTPYELGYGKTIKFDHDFVGADALKALGDQPQREKVTLVWNPDDVAGAFASLLGDEPPAKYMDLPKARYALYQFDAVRAADTSVGVSHDCGYIANERSFVSLASVDAAQASPGTELQVTWGEQPNSHKPQVEPHRQTVIRATVAPAPFVDFARSRYRAERAPAVS